MYRLIIAYKIDKLKEKTFDVYETRHDAENAGEQLLKDRHYQPYIASYRIVEE